MRERNTVRTRNTVREQTLACAALCMVSLALTLGCGTPEPLPLVPAKPGRLILKHQSDEGREVTARLEALDSRAIVATSVTMANVGESPVRIAEVERTGAILDTAPTNGAVGFLIEAIPQALAPGESVELTVSFFAPEQGAVQGQLIFRTEGEDGSEAAPVLTLTGKVAIAKLTCLTASSNAIDLGRVEEGCRAPDQELLLTSSCPYTFTLDQVEVTESPLVADDDPFCPGCGDLLVSVPTTPSSFIPTDVVSVAIGYLPRAEGDDRARVRFHYLVKGESAQLDVTIRGRASARDEQTETFAPAVRTSPLFPLSKLPDPPNDDGVRVEVDGAALPAIDPISGARSWGYDAPVNGVRFEEDAMPADSQTVALTYRPACGQN